MMRILIVASWYPTAECSIGGIFIAQQARALAECHDVTVLAPVVTASPAEPNANQDDAGAWNVVRPAITPGRGFLSRYCRVIRDASKKFRPDVIHAHVTIPAGVAAVPAGWFTRVPVVITEHLGPFSSCMRTVRNRIKVRFALRNAAAVIAVSNALKAAIQSYGIRRPIDVVPNVVDTSVFRCDITPAPNDGPCRVLFVGRLSDEQKNLPSLLRAIASLRMRGDYRLTVVGDGTFLDRYRKLAATLEIAGVCQFIPYVTPVGLNRLLQEHSLLALPSLGETFGCVLAEAIAAGRPVVATDCGGPRDIVTESTGVLVPIDDDARLAEAIAYIRGHLADYPPQRLSADGRERFGEAAIRTRLESIYRRVARHTAKVFPPQA